MKICAIICEFNPFHNGHKYLLETARKLSGCDAVLCIMSGWFTQRGEIAILSAYERAKHAVICGADCVLELPAAFSVAPAEIFARGAVKILSSIPSVTHIAFGYENGNDEDLENSAKILLNKSDAFKNTLSENLARGESYVKSYSAAFEVEGGKTDFLSKPNNILAMEYMKCISRATANIKIVPVKRIGAGFSDGEIKQNYSSASAIRRNLSSPLIKNNVPECVLNSLKDFSKENERYRSFLKLILSRTPPEELKKVYGCSEGLENLLKNLENLPFEEIIGSATSRRYPSSRIKRILCANFLRLQKADCESFLNSKLYVSPLAVKKERADGVLSALAQSNYPVITCGSDLKKLNKTALKCKNLDDFARLQWQQITGTEYNNKLVIV